MKKHEHIEKQITSRTKAILVVHYGGYPCRVSEIIDLAQRFKLAVIGDAAHAPGAFLSDRALGTWGDVGCFSFFSNKNLATGDAGMVITDRDDIAEKIRIMHSHGMTTLTWDRHRGHAHTYDVVELGNNYRIDEIRVALGLAQLRKLRMNNARRKVITGRYRRNLSEAIASEVGLRFADSPGQPSYHIFPILFPEYVDRRAFMNLMRQKGIQTSIHYPPIHKFTYYQKRYPGIYLPRTEEIASRELPLYPALKEEEVDYVLSVVTELLTQFRLKESRSEIQF